MILVSDLRRRSSEYERDGHLVSVIGLRLVVVVSVRARTTPVRIAGFFLIAISVAVIDLAQICGRVAGRLSAVVVGRRLTVTLLRRPAAVTAAALRSVRFDIGRAGPVSYRVNVQLERVRIGGAPSGTDRLQVAVVLP